MADRFSADAFIRDKIQAIKGSIGIGERVLLACSGGVCSNVVATILQRAKIEPNLVSVFVDTGFLRKDEVKTVSETISRAPLKLDLKVVDARKRLMRSVERAEEAAEKRRIFHEVFYMLLKNLAEEEEAKLVVLGTSLTSKTAVDQLSQGPPSVRSFAGRSPQLIEPLISLNRCQVLEVAQKLELPPRLSDLNPFPLPGLMIRVVGKVNDEKIKEVREATEVVEEELQYIKPAQYFAAIIENKDDNETNVEKMRERISDYMDVGAGQVDVMVPRSRVAGLKEGKRVYMKVSASRVTSVAKKELIEPDYEDLICFPVEFLERQNEFTRCLYNVTKKPKNSKYIAVIRAISTEDFTRASITRLDWGKLYSIAERIMHECGKVSSVYYDVTPKPPGTIELE